MLKNQKQSIHTTMETEKFIDSSNYSSLVSSMIASPVTNDNLCFLLTATNENTTLNNTKEVPFDEKISLHRDGVEKQSKAIASKSNILGRSECCIQHKLESPSICSPDIVITDDSRGNLNFLDTQGLEKFICLGFKFRKRRAVRSRRNFFICKRKIYLLEVLQPSFCSSFFDTKFNRKTITARVCEVWFHNKVLEE
jgi:hypothetical protein